MDIHKPKPVHGWREFAGEIGVIVIGVLIALSGEQVVEALHWRHVTAGARSEIYRDYAVDMAAFEERVAIQACAEKKLTELTDVLRRATNTHTIPAIKNVGRLPIRPLSRSAWTAAEMGGIALHLSAKERHNLADIDSALSEADSNATKEDDLWSALWALEGVPGSISDALLAQSSVTLGQLKQTNGYNEAVAEYGIKELSEIGISPAYATIVDDTRHPSKAQMLMEIQERDICRPLS